MQIVPQHHCLDNESHKSVKNENAIWIIFQEITIACLPQLQKKISLLAENYKLLKSGY
jgi:hypothetical protein